MMHPLVIVWSCLVALVIILYVLLDGFSLGIALLFPTAHDESERDLMMNSIAPVWDANQTWLVFGGGALFATFPLIYGVVFSALYIPLLTFVFGLIFRGITFEFRANATRKKPWNRAFFLGSLAAVMAQGVTLGGIISGTKVAEGHFAGGPFDWLNPFSFLVGLALIAGYTLLGCTYLIIKTRGPVQEKAYHRALRLGWLVLAFQVTMTVWTPLQHRLVWTNWFSSPRIYFIWAFPVSGLIAFYGLQRSLRARREILPFVFSMLFFLAGYLGLIASLYPYVVPPSITLQKAASQPETLRFTLWGAAIVLPVVLAYIFYSYAVFRGKVSAHEGHY